MKLYHKDVFLPNELVCKCPQLYCGNLEKTNHFFERSRGKFDKYIFDSDRFDEVIDEIRTEKPKPFEVETDDSGNVVKCCIRANFDDYRDICIVFRKNTIITFWFNGVGDNHYTLDTSKYCKA